MLWAWGACSGGGLIGDDTGVAVPRVWSSTGQAADVLLGGFGFDNSGGERVFNRPRGVVSSVHEPARRRGIHDSWTRTRGVSLTP